MLLIRGMAGAAPGSQNENILENYLRTEKRPVMVSTGPSDVLAFGV